MSDTDDIDFGEPTCESGRTYREMFRQLRQSQAPIMAELERMRDRMLELHKQTRTQIEDALHQALTQITAGNDTNRALTEQVEQLETALETRDLIWQAKMIIAGMRGCGADEAHDVLVRRSNIENRKLRDVARQIIEQHEARADGAWRSPDS